MISISGNVAGIGEFARKISRLASSDAKRSILENIAEEAIELVRDGFSKESDPYGSRWAALKYRSGRILQDTGRLRNSWHRRSINANRVVIGTGVDYARYHQAGTRRMPRRAMVPYRGLPPEWSKRLRDVALIAWKSSAGFR